MITHKLAGFDRALSALCMGTMNFGAGLTPAQSFDVLDAFVKMGGNFIDTARIYGAFAPAGMGASEKVIGAWLRARGNRDQVVIATKGAHPPVGDIHTGRMDKANLTADLDASLEALGIGTIDLYWLHRDDEARPVEEILETLNGFIAQGKIRQIGASNWRPERLRAARDKARAMALTGFVADQPMWSLAKAYNIEDTTLYEVDAKLYHWHRESGMACMPYTSQAKGFFAKMSAGGEGALSEKARERYLTPSNVRLYGEVRTIGEETGLSAGAVALAFLTNQPDFSVYPIVGVSNMTQVDALTEAADARLSDAQMQRLMALTTLE